MFGSALLDLPIQFPRLGTTTSSSYLHWSTLLRTYLESKDLWTLISGERSSPSQLAEDYHEALGRLHRDDAHARSILLSSVDFVHFQHIRDLPSAKRQWDKLHEIQTGSRENNIISLLRQFYHFEAGHKSLDEVVSCLNDLQAAIEECGDPGDRPSDRAKTMVLMENLEESYSVTLTCAVLASGSSSTGTSGASESLIFERMVARLKEQELLQNARANANGKSSGDDENLIDTTMAEEVNGNDDRSQTNATEDGDGNGDGDRDGDAVSRCYACGEQGHWAAECSTGNATATLKTYSPKKNKNNNNFWNSPASGTRSRGGANSRPDRGNRGNNNKNYRGENNNNKRANQTNGYHSRGGGGNGRNQNRGSRSGGSGGGGSSSGRHEFNHHKRPASIAEFPTQSDFVAPEGSLPDEIWLVSTSPAATSTVPTLPGCGSPISAPPTPRSTFDLLTSQVSTSSGSTSPLPSPASTNDASKKKSKRGWFIDSGATTHMTPHRSLFSHYEPLTEPTVVRMADGHTTLYAVGRGDVCIRLDGSSNTRSTRSKGSWNQNQNQNQTSTPNPTPTETTTKAKKVVITDVLYVPGLSANVLSVGKLNEKGIGVLHRREGTVLSRRIKGRQVQGKEGEEEEGEEVVVARAEKKGGRFLLETIDDDEL